MHSNYASTKYPVLTWLLSDGDKTSRESPAPGPLGKTTGLLLPQPSFSLGGPAWLPGFVDIGECHCVAGGANHMALLAPELDPPSPSPG